MADLKAFAKKARSMATSLLGGEIDPISAGINDPLMMHTNPERFDPATRKLKKDYADAFKGDPIATIRAGLGEEGNPVDLSTNPLVTNAHAYNKLKEAAIARSQSRGTTFDDSDKIRVASEGFAHLLSTGGGTPERKFDLDAFTTNLFGDSSDDKDPAARHQSNMGKVLSFYQDGSAGALRKAQLLETHAFARAGTNVIQASRERYGQLQRTESDRFKPKTRTRQVTSGLLGDSDSFGNNSKSLLG